MRVEQNSVVVVTGASRGIGRAIACAFAEQGACVVVTARSTSETGPLAGTIHDTARDVEQRGGTAVPIAADISRDEDIAALVQQVMDRCGRIDVLINNAATNRPLPFEHITMKQWDMILRVNLRGMVACSKEVVPVMKQQHRGHIINISSVAAHRPGHEPFTGLAYDVSKAAVNRFTVGLAEELRPCRIGVNALMPDNTKTEGWVYLNPDMNTAGWQNPAIWGAYAVYIARQDPSVFTGKILPREELPDLHHSE